VDRKRPLAAALGLADPQQTPFEVDVVPVQPEQLASAKAGIGKKAEQQLVAFALAREVALPDIVTLDDREEPGELAAVEHIRQGVALLRRSEHVCRVAVEVLVPDQEAEEALESRDRARLASNPRSPLSLGGEEGA
jgi:hypothetical protein